jgi:glucose/arabinose dehydrogenase
MKKQIIFRWLGILCTAILGLLVLAFVIQQPVRADQPTAVWPSLQLQVVANGFTRPVHIANAGDGSQRLFVVEQAGIIRILTNGGNTLSTPFLDISDRVRSPGHGGGSEEGLLSLAFPPDYDKTGAFYVYYTNTAGDNRISRFRLTADANVADASSEELILLLEHPVQSNHNGGQLAFGADGYLYIGTGDGGGAGDPSNNAQDLSSLLGKVLRIDVALPVVSGQSHKLYLPCIIENSAGEPKNEQPYRIPSDNPFVNTPNARPEIWAYGLRNPWRITFDRQTHDMWIGDVGQGQYEEVDLQLASSTGGENYGWRVMEGNHCYNAATCSQSGLVLPITEYDHTLGCSITGGFIYRGSGSPALQGIYLYGDFCSGRIWGLQNSNGWQSQQLLASGLSISTFGEGENGEMYLADMSAGGIYQITSSNP